MMLGPMKKKMITTGVITFLIPTVALGAAFLVYSNNTKKEIANLQEKAKVTEVQVFSGDLPVNHIITADDIRTFEVKSESVPLGSYFVGEDDEIIGKKLKIAVADKTIINDLMFFAKEDNIAIDIRSKEFNMITLPSDMEVGDYIDIRILFPTGEDFLVVAGKEVKNVGVTADSNAVFLDLTEEELVRLSGAIIESYIADSIKVYAVKYVKPNPQLYHDEDVNYVAKYKDAVKYLQELNKTTEEVEVEPSKKEPLLNESGEQMVDENGNLQYKEIEAKYETVDKVPTEYELDVADIAKTAGISKDDADAIREALKNNDTILISKYENYSVTVWTPLEENYPVRKEVATLVANNPNIVDEIKSKYNVEKLEQERQNLIDTSVFEYDEYTGEIVEKDEAKSSVASKLEEEIETQKAERKEYLQALLRNSMMSN